MPSFFQLWEALERQGTAESPAMRAVRSGLNLREDFWDDFIRVCNDAPAVADLLGVSVNLVETWGSRVSESLDKVKGQEEENPTRTKVLDTGLPQENP